MKIAFCSNFLNHHQLPFSLEMYNRNDIQYYFIATEQVPEERINLGYENMNDKYPFVIKAYEDMEKALKICNESDVVIIGSAPDIYIEERMKKNKLTYRYSERVLRKGRWRALDPRIIKSMLKNHIRFKNKKLYMLCASAYTAKDFGLFGAYKHKCYKWGYFPECEFVDIDELVNKKTKNRKIKILWVARFIKLKHPEIIIKLTRKLIKCNYDFQITMIGSGELLEKIKNIVKKEKLEKYIKIIGSVKYDKVRQYMKDANIFLFTSDKREGWGAVLNEAMNSGCAIVANSQIGSVPYLIKNEINGLIYNNNMEFYKKVKVLLNDKEKRDKLAKEAYYTIYNVWNAKNASNMLINLSNRLQEGKNLYIEEGPCSLDNGML